MSNSIANSSTMNLLPVQAYFNADGTFNTFVGQGQPFTVPASNIINGATINNSSIGATTPSTGAFTSLSSTQDATINGLTVGKGNGNILTNTALGNGALASANSGTGRNSAFGYVALGSNTTGYYSNAFGMYALYFNTTGFSNDAVGYSSLFSNVSGSQNVSMGQSSLYNNTSGSSNSAIGYQALYSNNASNNTAVGYQAGYSNTTGSFNNFSGYQTGYSLSTGVENAFYGAQAGYSVTTGSYNTFIGRGIGTAAGSNVTTGSKNTIIGGYNGNNGGLDIRTASNYIVLSDGDGNPRQIIDGSGNLLVGTTTAYNVDGNGFNLNVGSGTSLITKHITGTSSGAYYALYMYGGSAIGSITQSGTTAVLYNVTSDQRLKTNIVDAPAGNIDSIKVRSFDWITDNTHQTYGMVAQELLEVAPYAVHQPIDKEEMMAVDYSKLVPMMIKEIQDLKAKVTQLETQLGAK